jgi:uncharacterized protein
MSLIKITVFPNSSKNRIVHSKNDVFEARLKASPVQNQANTLLLQLLADYLSLPTKNLKIISGYHSRHKLIEINDDEATLNYPIEHKKTAPES